MKKNILILGIIFLLIGASVVSSTEYLTTISKKSNINPILESLNILLDEDFSGTFPPEGWSMDGWEQYNSSCVGSEPPCAMWYKYNQSPPYYGASVISKAVDASGYEKFLLKFYFGADVQYNNYVSAYVKYRRNETSSWIDITPWDNPIPIDMECDYYEIEVPCGSEECGDALQINWSYIGYYYYINYLWIDDVKILSGGKTAYAYIAYSPVHPEGPCYFDLNDPSNLTSFDILNCPDFCCGTWTNNGKWLVCDVTGALWEINLCNNTASLIGGGGVSLTGLSYNPMNDKLYGCSESDLYEINMFTGDQTYIGSFGLSGKTIIAIAINIEGRAFIWDILFSGSSTLWEVDLETGDATEIGSMGQNLCYAQDGAFDWETGILYLAAYSSYGFLATCDIETGELTPIGNFEGGSELCSLAIPHSDDFCPPITTISLDPPTPDGDTGWYVSGVNVTLTATDDMSGVKGIYYRINENEWIYNSGDYVLFLVDYDCLEGFIEYYSVDFAGNQEETRSFGIDMDQLPPEFNVKYDKQSINDSWLFIFNFNCWDNCSGVDRVEFLLNGVLQDTVTGPGPEYTWEFLYSGGLKITITMVACDRAGNCASSDVKINFNRNSKQQSIKLLLQLLDHFPFLKHLSLILYNI